MSLYVFIYQVKARGQFKKLFYDWFDFPLYFSVRLSKTLQKSRLTCVLVSIAYIF